MISYKDHARWSGQYYHTGHTCWLLHILTHRVAHGWPCCSCVPKNLLYILYFFFNLYSLNWEHTTLFYMSGEKNTANLPSYGFSKDAEATFAAHHCSAFQQESATTCTLCKAIQLCLFLLELSM